MSHKLLRIFLKFGMKVGYHSRVPPFLKGGGTRFLNFSKRGGPKKNFGGGGKKKGWGKIFKNKGGETQLFKSNLWIELNKNGDF